MGAVLGAVLGIYFTISAHKPQLTISTGGSGTRPNKDKRWQLRISNSTSFLWWHLEGETARDLVVRVSPKDGVSSSYTLHTIDETGLAHTTFDLEPGMSRTLEAFKWNFGDEGYCLCDSTGKPLARFNAPTTEFKAWTIDRLQRKTEWHFTVIYDSRNLEEAASLRIKFPVSFATRRAYIRKGLTTMLEAFRPR